MNEEFKITDMRFDLDGIRIMINNPDAVISQIYLDEINNQCAKYSDDPSKHSYVIGSDVFTRNANIIMVPYSVFNNKPHDAYIANVLGAIRLAVREDKLYQQEVAFVVGNYCETCLDKVKKNAIDALFLTRTMFYQAYNFQLTDEAITYYMLMCRMLGYYDMCGTGAKFLRPNCDTGCCGNNCCPGGVCNIPYRK